MIERALGPHGGDLDDCNLWNWWASIQNIRFRRLIGSLRKLDLLVTAELQQAAVVLRAAVWHVFFFLLTTALFEWTFLLSIIFKNSGEPNLSKTSVSTHVLDVHCSLKALCLLCCFDWLCNLVTTRQGKLETEASVNVTAKNAAPHANMANNESQEKRKAERMLPFQKHWNWMVDRFAELLGSNI